MTAGHYHVGRFVSTGYTSTLTGNNPLSMRFHASLDSRLCCGPTGMGWASQAIWGFNSYDIVNTTWPRFVRVYLKYWKMRIVLRQQNEQCRVRVCIAKPRRRDMLVNNNVRDQWSPDVDVPISWQYWKVLYQKIVTFEQTTISGQSETFLGKVKYLDLVLPMNRILETKTRTPATVDTDWEPPGAEYSDYAYLFVDSDDLTNVDQQFVEVKVYNEFLFYELD